MSRLCTPNWLDTYLEYTKFQEAPIKYHLWVGLSILAATVRRNVCLDRGYFSIYPNLYTALVGPSGFSKTTAADMGMDLLNELPEIDLMREKLTSYFLLDYFDKLTKSKGECCVTIYAPEMKNFLGDLNKTEIVTLLTSWYGNPTKTDYRTKGGGILKFTNVNINLLACSTPEWLTMGTTAEEIAGGFTGRFAYVYEDTSPRSFPFPEDFITPETAIHKQNLITDLQHIANLKGNFIMTDQARGMYIVWYNQRKNECTDERTIGYFSRKRDLVLKISMLVSIAQDDTLVIDEDILQTAFDILTKMETKLAGVFSGVVSDPALKYKDSIYTQIKTSADRQITRTELLRKNWHRMDGLILDRIMTNLIEANLVDCENRVAKNGKRGTVYKLIH